MTDVADMAAVLSRVMRGREGTCATFTVRGDPGRWVQFVDGQVNMASFAVSPPKAVVEALGPAAIVAFQPRKYLTVRLVAQDPYEVAGWIHGYFLKALDAPEGFLFDADIEQL
ncbi:hypothetical protein ACETK8_05015 [Brevundimonas staleyi]|uniref:Uncharacterized protein n=1 Tax=Brevundimonas staleyi TaxID=74326 RepID=A0ABW0FY66_9CAUL